ncbi:exopolyphosphatase/guanosine-5'-triphosphate,3'-diphosphate pyrophosphatase [Povalibacter uvarum]|uniref:Exopolyphosphatase n=1 Tax=Povalibacter uvarum TaxID=732238 RepID=A0A841HR04_9GAMM|nr:exopolyphosphatase [Povalibacter uvarum]MBB6095657.1 exopolyphosphatase/guanosine-5'-triphosphate,3'-diphosphate pyrophosphatase [Povalibacter uvarum]
MARSKVPDVIAAVDLGSNSFHMVVARHSHGQIIILDRLREMVRLAAGLDETGRLDRSAIETALACLERFGQRLRDMKAESVRVVGTNTLRRAKRKGAFLDRARNALGHPIEIISGIEEARLIYLGVAHTMPSEPGRRLVADIGGGSTEIIIGEGVQTRKLESLYMGCVSTSSRFFDGGEVSEKRMKRARLAARLELQPVRSTFRDYGFDSAVGSSGTIRSVSDVLRARGGDGVITPAAVESLIDHTIRAGNVDRIRLPGLSEERVPVFAGGLAILAEILHVLDIKQMKVADGALREGLLYDLIGRLTDEDARTRSVRAMQGRYHVDVAQADRVEATTQDFLAQTQKEWGLEDPFAALVLSWSAKLHEIGLDVSHSHYHKHGAYLLEHADMPGFPQEEQRILARIVGAHRRKIHLEDLEDLTPPWHLKVEFLIVILRLAVLLHRGRSSAALPKIGVHAKGRSLDLTFPSGWIEDYPLTMADLENEAEYLKSTGFRLKLL